MATNKIIAAALGTGLMLAVGLVVAVHVVAVHAQEPEDQARVAEPAQLPVSDPSCTFFGPDHDKFVSGGNARSQARLTMNVASRLSTGATNAMPSAPGGSRTGADQTPSSNTIDKYIFPALAAAGVAPAPPTTDFEFVRRAYLDLTGKNSQRHPDVHFRIRHPRRTSVPFW